MTNKNEIELNRLSKLMSLDQIKVLPYHTKFEYINDMPINQALVFSKIGYFEWDVEKRILYISKIVYEYCNIDEDYDGTYIELLYKVLEPDKIIDFLNNFSLATKSDRSENVIEFRIYSTSLNEFRWIKITAGKISDSLDEKLIIGTMQDITEFKIAKLKQEDSEYILRKILDSVPLPIIYFGREDKLQLFNRAAESCFDCKFGTPIGITFDEYNLIFKNNYEYMDKKIVTEKDDHIEYQIHVIKDGISLDLRVDLISIYNKNNDYIGKVIVHDNITQSIQNLKNITKLLKANELSIEIKDYIEKIDDLNELYELILSRLSEVIPNASRGCVLRLDYDDNLYIASHIGYDDKYADGFKVPFKDSFANSDLGGNYNRSIIINNIQQRYTEVFPDINTQNRGFILESNITAPICLDGKLYGILSIDCEIKNAFDEVDLNLVDYIRIQIERSITIHKKHRNVVKISRQDALTGLFNRRYLMEMFDKRLVNSRLLNEIFSFVVFDIDDLKIINDKLGHLAGDMILKQFSGLALNETRNDDIIARYGGDEFVGIFLNINKEDLLRKLESWKLDLSKRKFQLNGEFIFAKFSYGIAMFPSDGNDFNSLMTVADKSMYKNKNHKRGIS